MPRKTNLATAWANRAVCLFLAANEKIFESHHLLSQSMCSRGAVGQTAACSVAAILHALLHAKPCTPSLGVLG